MIIQSIKPHCTDFDRENGIMLTITVTENHGIEDKPDLKTYRDCLQLHQGYSIRKIVKDLRSFTDRLERRYIPDAQLY